MNDQQKELTTLAELLMKYRYGLFEQLRDDGCEDSTKAVFAMVDAVDALIDKADVPEEETVSSHPWLKGRLAGSCLA